MVREEHEVALTEQQFKALWPATASLRLSKVRYVLKHQELKIEVDVYQESLEGLIVAEIEFSEEQVARAFAPLPWFGREVTHDPDFKNQQLAKLKSTN